MSNVTDESLQRFRRETERSNDHWCCKQDPPLGVPMTRDVVSPQKYILKAKNSCKD